MDLENLVQRIDLGAVGLGTREVGDVDGVARVARTADVTAPEVRAALLRDAAERVAAVLAEIARRSADATV